MLQNNGTYDQTHQNHLVTNDKEKKNLKTIVKNECSVESKSEVKYVKVSLEIMIGWKRYDWAWRRDDKQGHKDPNGMQ